jgi:diguanylate cyclase (GGDEF)-like protein/PAS domain S-box-containing protein
VPTNEGVTHQSEPLLGGIDLRACGKRETSLLLQAAAAGLAGVPFTGLASLVLARLRDVLHCEGTAFYEFSEQSAKLTLCDHASGRMPTEALAVDDPQLVETIAAAGSDPVERRSGAASSARSDLTVAVRGTTKLYGILAAATSAPAGFSPSAHNLMRGLAAILAMSRRAEHRKKVAQALFDRSRDVFELNPKPMMIVDAATLRYLDVNRTAVDVYGYTREQWLSMTPYDIGDPRNADEFTRAMRVLGESGSVAFNSSHRKANGSALDAHSSVTTIEREEAKVYVVTVQDMTERNEVLARSRRSEETLALAQRQLEHNALHDGLTGLANRVLLHERLNAAIEHAHELGRMTAVLFIDIDQFKNVNDTLGHAAGDVLLREIGERLRAHTRQTDCIARLGGDEFVAVLGEIGDVEHVATIARNLGRVMAKPVRLADRDVVSTCSIGVAIYPQHGTDAETLIRNADTAMYRAKRDGRATTSFFTPEMLEEAPAARPSRTTVP